MNIRELIHETTIDGYYHKGEFWAPHSWFTLGHFEERSFFIPDRREVTRTLQCLNTDTKEWEDLPQAYEYSHVPAPK